LDIGQCPPLPGRNESGELCAIERLESAQNIINALREAGWFDRNKALGEAHPGLYEVAFTKNA